MEPITIDGMVTHFQEWWWVYGLIILAYIITFLVIKIRERIER
jgi:hypothetical protein